jgi:tol-pal system protein YbgF
VKLRATLSVLILTFGPTFTALAEQRLSDLLLQIQRLQQEVQQLRGQVELQQHEISTLKRQQREQYMDLDARLQGRPGASSGQEAGQGAAPGAGAPISRAQEGELAMSPRPGTGSQSGSAGPAGEKDAYRTAFDLLKQRRYDEAIRAFEDLLARYPDGEFADNARYWLGETNYVKRDYNAALTQFQRVLANYPLSPKVPSAMLKIGYIHYDQSDWQRARTTLQDVAKKYPDSTEARLAGSRLDRMTREGH